METAANRVWWFPSVRRFWLASGDPRADLPVLLEHQDAIHVTHPPQAFVDSLQRERDRVEQATA